MTIAEHESPSREAGLGDLYRRYAHWLTAMVRRRGGGDESEDIVQEAYLRVARLPVDAPVRHPKALLLQVAQNLMRNAARDAARRTAGVRLGDDTPAVAQAHQFQHVALKESVLALPEICRTSSF